MIEFRTVDVANMTSTRGGGAGTGLQALGEVRRVNVADDRLDEMAATDSASAIHGEGGFPGMAGFSSAGISGEIPMEIRVHGG